MSRTLGFTLLFAMVCYINKLQTPLFFYSYFLDKDYFQYNKISATNIIHVFHAWAVNIPEYFREVQGTAHCVLLPEAQGRGQKNTMSCSLHRGNKSGLLTVKSLHNFFIISIFFLWFTICMLQRIFVPLCNKLRLLHVLKQLLEDLLVYM